MPATSKAQQHLMGAAAHGVTFPMAQKVRRSMSLRQLRDFASGSTKGKPMHVRAVKRASHTAAPHPHRNLGKFLHPAKGR